MFREGNENYKIKSHGRARKNEANSRKNSRDREFSLVSARSGTTLVRPWWSLCQGFCLLCSLSISSLLSDVVTLDRKFSTVYGHTYKISESDVQPTEWTQPLIRKLNSSSPKISRLKAAFCFPRHEFHYCVHPHQVLWKYYFGNWIGLGAVHLLSSTLVNQYILKMDLTNKSVIQI